MITTKIINYFKVTPTGIIPPPKTEVERKREWFAALQKTVEAPYKPLLVRETLEVFDPEIENQKRFFEGAVVPYYAIQNMDGDLPDSKVLKFYREKILDEALGFNLTHMSQTIRKRKSTTDFKDVQRWNVFLKTLEETIFAQAGFAFPDSKVFWELEKQHGYEAAKRISIERLQADIQKKI